MRHTRIKDRLLVGILSGLAGGAASIAIREVGARANLFRSDLTERAAAPLMGRKAKKPMGHFAAQFNEMVQDLAAGTAITYALCLTGPRIAALKGAMVACGMNSFVFGTLASMIKTGVGPGEPRTILGGWVATMAFGVAAGSVAKAIGDPSLYDGSARPWEPVYGRAPDSHSALHRQS